MKKNRRFGIIIIIIGILIILYPLVANLISFFTQSRVVLNYQLDISNLSNKEIAVQKENIKKYNEQITNESIIINDENTVEGVSYLNVLDIGDVIGYVSIPLIDVYLPIYHGTSEEVLQAGVGHVEGSSFPIGDEGTHAVFAGHTGLVRAKMFDDLDKLEIGNKFYIYILDDKYTYEVDQIVKVLPEEVDDYIKIEEEHEYVTLMTCAPYGINTHRLLVRGTRIEDDDASLASDETILKNKMKALKIVLIIIFVIFIIILIILLILLIYRKMRSKKEERYSEK